MSAICGGTTASKGGHNFRVLAILSPEPENLHDSNAVAVVVDGHQVAYIPKGKAAKLQKSLLKMQKRTGKPVGCRAKIVGGWDHGEDDRGHFGIQLFFDPTHL